MEFSCAVIHVLFPLYVSTGIAVGIAYDSVTLKSMEVEINCYFQSAKSGLQLF